MQRATWYANGGVAEPLRRASLALALAAAAALLLACAAKPPPPPMPKTLVIDVRAAANVNPDARGRPSPVVVRIYELKAAGPFETADFLSLYDKDQAVLGAELVVRDEFVLQPGESKSLKRAAGESKFLAVMAAFRDLERSRWRAASPMTLGSDNSFSIQLDATTIQVTKR